MITHPQMYGQKITAKEFAKYVVWQMGETAEYYSENYTSEYYQMTQDERDKVIDEIYEQQDRVKIFLGIYKTKVKYGAM